MNPEFRRNLWQELSMQRLIAMPAILLAIFSVVYLKGGLQAIPEAALTLIFLLSVIWGSGLSTDAIFQEIREHTWDAQRMTPLGPWSMTWGKLFGSTIFVWYGITCCLAALLFAFLHKEWLHTPNLFFNVIYYLLTGIFTQAFGLFIALLFQRISPLRTRAKVVLIQLFVICFGLGLFSIGRVGLPETFALHTWYNLGIGHQKFAIATQLFFCAALFFGIYRILRYELQIRSLPWAWPLFLVIFIFYSIGFVYTSTQKIPRDYLEVVWVGIAYGMTLTGTVLAAFFTPKNIVQYFRCIKYLKQRRFLPALSVTPTWILTGSLAIPLLFVLIYLLNRPDFPEPKSALTLIGFSFSLLFFMLRDIGILYYITFNIHAKRAHLASLVYIIALYTLLPMLLSFTAIPDNWYSAFAPWSWMTETEPVASAQIFLIVSLVFLQALMAWALVSMRWRVATKELA